MKIALTLTTLLTLFSFVDAKEKQLYQFPLPLEFSQEDALLCDSDDPFPIPEVSASANKRTLHDEVVDKSKYLEEQLLKKIYGQDEAVKETANAILRFAAGVSDPSMPIASLLYCGPSGVGKTELAKQLCLELYGSSKHFCRINMSEFSEAHSVSRLIGAPPGYVGYDKGGSLSTRLLENPYSVVLLDEVEKAHPMILKLFMHVFDAGYFTSSRGEDVDCRKAIFILTSNIGSLEIAKWYRSGLNNKDILEVLEPQLMDYLSPELYNRLDCMVFAPLSDAIFEKLIRQLLNSMRNRIIYSKDIEVNFDQSIVDYLKQFSLDPLLGARPLKRIIEKQLATVIATAIIDSACKRGDTILCSYKEGHVLLEVVFSCIDYS